jgi:hypothetical protein
MENLTSSAVTGSPSWKTASSRIVIVQVRPSSDTDHSVASSGKNSPASLIPIGVSYTSSYRSYASASRPLPGFRLSGDPPMPMRTVPPVGSSPCEAVAPPEGATLGVAVVPQAASTMPRMDANASPGARDT